MSHKLIVFSFCVLLGYSNARADFFDDFGDDVLDNTRYSTAGGATLEESGGSMNWQVNTTGASLLYDLDADVVSDCIKCIIDEGAYSGFVIGDMLTTNVNFQGQARFEVKTTVVPGGFDTIAEAFDGAGGSLGQLAVFTNVPFTGAYGLTLAKSPDPVDDMNPDLWVISYSVNGSGVLGPGAGLGTWIFPDVDFDGISREVTLAGATTPTVAADSIFIQVPEPGCLALFSTFAVGLVFRRKRSETRL